MFLASRGWRDVASFPFQFSTGHFSKSLCIDFHLLCVFLTLWTLAALSISNFIIPTSMTLSGCSEWVIKLQRSETGNPLLARESQGKKGFAPAPQKIAHKQKSLTSKQSRHGHTTQVYQKLDHLPCLLEHPRYDNLGRQTSAIASVLGFPD